MTYINWCKRKANNSESNVACVERHETGWWKAKLYHKAQDFMMVGTACAKKKTCNRQKLANVLIKVTKNVITFVSEQWTNLC